MSKSNIIEEAIEEKALKLINELDDGYHEFEHPDCPEFTYDGNTYSISGYLDIRTFDDSLCGDGEQTSTTYISGVVGVNGGGSDEIVIKF
jgi:hypothetical protein